MNANSNPGRWIGAALLAVMVLEAVNNFMLQASLFGGEGVVANAASQRAAIGCIIVLGVLASGLSVWVAATSSSLFGRAHPFLAWTYFALAVSVLAVTVVEVSTFMAMRGVSELYLASDPGARVQLDGATAVARGLRNGIHFSNKMMGGASVLAFYLLLFKARAIPRPLAAFGIVAAPLQMIGVALPLFGLAVVYPLLAPLGLAYAATSVWLLVKGFATPVDQPTFV